MPADKGPQLKIDQFTAKAVPDPKSPDAQLVTGFLGASSESDKTRIYFDASLSSFVDVATSDILNTQAIPESQSPLGGSYIWLKRSAVATFGSAGGQSSTGTFFQGPLMAAYGGQFAGAAAGAVVPTPPIPVQSHYVICNPSPYLCTRYVTCGCPPSYYHPCASHIVVCFTPLCPIQSAICSPNCPVASPGCPPVGPGTPVQGGGQEFAAQMMPGAIPSLVCSYGPGCWYSWNACPTDFGCGPHNTPGCPRFQAAPAIHWTGWQCGSGFLCPPPHSIGSCGHPCTM